MPHDCITALTETSDSNRLLSAHTHTQSRVQTLRDIDVQKMTSDRDAICLKDRSLNSFPHFPFDWLKLFIHNSDTVLASFHIAVALPSNHCWFQYHGNQFANPFFPVFMWFNGTWTECQTVYRILTTSAMEICALDNHFNHRYTRNQWDDDKDNMESINVKHP